MKFSEIEGFNYELIFCGIGGKTPTKAMIDWLDKFDVLNDVIGWAENALVNYGFENFHEFTSVASSEVVDTLNNNDTIIDFASIVDFNLLKGYKGNLISRLLKLMEDTVYCLLATPIIKKHILLTCAICIYRNIHGNVSGLSSQAGQLIHYIEIATESDDVPQNFIDYIKELD